MHPSASTVASYSSLWARRPGPDRVTSTPPGGITGFGASALAAGSSVNWTWL